jgi:outer membrane immunogenic protein
VKRAGLFFLVSLGMAGPALAGQAGRAGDAADWTGFYAGLYGAYGWGTTTSDAARDAHPKDPFGGVEAGYNADVSGFILGIEADASMSDLDSDSGSGATFLTQDVDHIFGLRARAGLPIDNALLFVSAGWSWADTEYGIGAAKQQKGVSGPAVGFGLQYAASDSVSWRIEYLHHDYGSTTYDLGTPVKARNSVNEIKLGVDFSLH